MGRAQEKGGSKLHSPPRSRPGGGAHFYPPEKPQRLATWLLPCALHTIPLLLSLSVFLWSLAVFRQASKADLSSVALNCPPLPPQETPAPPALPHIPGDSGSSVPPGGHIDGPVAGVEETRAQGRRVMREIEEMIGEEHRTEQERQHARQLHSRAGNRHKAHAEQLDRWDRLNAEADIPSLSIFCAPKSYTDEPGDPQRRALLSWLRLLPPPKIVLLGEDPSFYKLAKEFPGRILVEPDIDYNFYGVPLFHSMLARAQAADTDLSMIINGDIILLNDIMLALNKLLGNFGGWVLTAARWDVGKEFPFSFSPEDMERSGRTVASWDREVGDFAREHGSLHTYGGVDFWLWNNSPTQLFHGAMPPFAFGRGKYDNWLTHEIVASGLRQMVDASEAITSIHVKHDYTHVQDAAQGQGQEQKSFWSTRKQTSWELFANIHMAQSHGSYSNQLGTALHVPWRLSSCLEPSAHNMCIQKRARPANCSCEYSPFAIRTQSDPKTDGKNWVCGVISVDRQQDFSINPVANRESKPGLPHTMEQLLPQVARHLDGLKVVTLAAVTHGYREMLMNFVCRLRMLGLADNLLIAALDKDLYEYTFLQGLAVYYQKPGKKAKGMDSASCAFGSECFRHFTKLKSRAVLRVLKAGYSVLWSDVDIVWFRDPLEELLAYGPGTLPIQSNEPNASLSGAGIRRINSGFYFARSDRKTIEAFEAITAHAATTKLSEQPSFYDILCGVQGELRVRGKEECVWTNGLRTIFLDRLKYPNGAVHGFWEEKDVTKACKRKGCAILHNNWISGKDAKRQRMVSNGYWHYDADRRLCKWPWHDRLHPLFYGNEGKREAANVD